MILPLIFIFPEEEGQNETAHEFMKLDIRPFRNCDVSIAGYTIGFGEAAKAIFNTSLNGKI